jgi:hypothetical protein
MPEDDDDLFVVDFLSDRDPAFASSMVVPTAPAK